MTTTLRMRIVIPLEDEVPIKESVLPPTPLRALGIFLLVNVAVGMAILLAAMVAQYPPMTVLLICLGAVCSLNWSMKAARRIYLPHPESWKKSYSRRLQY